MSIDAGGYGYRHRMRRQKLAPKVEAGMELCWRCGKPITIGEPWDLGHADGQATIYMGAEHRRCNRATAGRKARTNPPTRRLHSRRW
jgi:hypothetical protein